jgi:hypothetical protein
MDLTKIGKPIENVTTKAEVFGDLNYIFLDSKYLPLDVVYQGNVERKSSSGIDVPYYVFSKETKIFLISLWNKNLNIPLELKPKDDVRIYVNEKKQLEILKLN